MGEGDPLSLKRSFPVSFAVGPALMMEFYNISTMIFCISNSHSDGWPLLPIELEWIRGQPLYWCRIPSSGLGRLQKTPEMNVSGWDDPPPHPWKFKSITLTVRAFWKLWEIRLLWEIPLFVKNPTFPSKITRPLGWYENSIQTAGANIKDTGNERFSARRKRPENLSP